MITKIYRASLIFFLLGIISFSIYFIYNIAVVDSTGAYFLNIIALVVLIIFSLIEIALLIKGFFKDDIIIRNIVLEGDKLNKGPFIINNVLLGISLIIVITLSVLTILNISDKINSFYVLISIFSLLLINNIYYDLYLLVLHLKNKEIYKLIK